jgi:hypothetical protein
VGLTKTLMPLKLCEFCCAGATYLSGAGLRSRRHGRLCFGTEGLGKPEALHTRNTSARGWRRPGTSLKARRDQGRSSAVSAPKVRRAATRVHGERVKEAPYNAETRSAACKGVSAVRRHAGGLYDAGSYCYTLVKCLKPFVRNEKGVIEANDHAQGPPINGEPLVMKQTHRNEKRAPKATASLSVFGLLSVSLLHFLFC